MSDKIRRAFEEKKEKKAFVEIICDICHIKFQSKGESICYDCSREQQVPLENATWNKEQATLNRIASEQNDRKKEVREIYDNK